MNLAAIEHKVKQGVRLDRREAEHLFINASDRELSEMASTAKARYHPVDHASYLIMAIVNYTNICVAKCDYCSFYRLPHQSGTYLLSFEQVCQKIDSLLELGGTLVGFNGGFHPKLRIDDYARLFEKIHSRYPDICFFEMTIAEFMFSSKVSKLSYPESAKILREAGTRWITGGGAEILDDSFRLRHSPGKFKVDDYYCAQRAILDAGISSTATMVIGFDESLEERFNHLEKLRDFQDQTPAKLTSFLCWTYKPYHNDLGGEEIESREYLRWLAITRLYLDNFKHIRTSVLTQNEEALVGIKYGADDFDLPTEDEVTEKAGARISIEFDNTLKKAKADGITLTHRRPFAANQQVKTSLDKHTEKKLPLYPEHGESPENSIWN